VRRANGVHAFRGLPDVIGCRNLGLIGAIESGCQQPNGCDTKVGFMNIRLA